MSQILKFSTQTSLLEQLRAGRRGTKSAALTPNLLEIHFFLCSHPQTVGIHTKLSIFASFYTSHCPGILLQVKQITPR